MQRPLDTRLDQVETRRTAAAAQRDSAAIRDRRIWRVEAAMGAVIRSALACAGVDPTAATRLCVADEAAAALAAIPDMPELQRADDNDTGAADAQDRAPVDAFASKIQAMTRGFADGKSPDFANAPFAELLAWSLAQPAAE